MLQTRTRLMKEWPQHRDAGELAKAAAVLERVAFIEEQFASLQPVLPFSLAHLADLYRRQEGFARERRTWLRAAGVWRRQYGESDWRTRDFLLAAKNAERMARLEPEDRARLAQANRLAEKANQLHAQGKPREALRLALRVVRIRKEVLGEDHSDHARALSHLTVMYFALGDYESALGPARQGLRIMEAAVGPDHPSMASAYNNLGMLYLERGDPKRALPLLARALVVRKATLGADNLEYVGSLINLASLYRHLRDYHRAKPLCEEALAIYARTQGKRHPLYLTSLFLLGGVLRDMRESRQALPVLLEVRDMRKAVLGEKHPDYAHALHGLALVYRNLGEYGKALPLFEEALAIRKDVLGTRHPDYAESLDQLALLHVDLGNPRKAMEMCRQALALRKKALGEKHPGYARTLSNLAMIHHALGHRAEALATSKAALDLRKEVLGVKHPEYALSLNNFASLHRGEGEFHKALVLLQEAVSLSRETAGEKSEMCCVAMRNLAAIHQDLSEYQDALPLLEKVLAIRKETLGGKHPLYGDALEVLGLLHSLRGKPREALPLLEKARKVFQETRGEKHPAYAHLLNSLAHAHQAVGDKEEALALQGQARELMRRTHGEKHPEFATVTMNLAGMHLKAGRIDKARLLLEETSRSLRETVGDRHWLFIRCQTGLAAVAWADGDREQAEKLLSRSLTFDHTFLEDTLSVLAERQRLKLLGGARRALDQYLSVAIHPGADTDGLYQRVIGWKGLVTARHAEEALLRDQPDLASLFADLCAARASLARLAAQTPAAAERRAWRERLAAAQQEKERLEARLAASSAAFYASRSVDAKQITRSLPPDAALVDLLEYKHTLPPAARGRPWRGERRLLAFVLRKGEKTVLLDLGATEPIDKAVAEWRHSLGSTPAARKASELLRQRVWLPIEKHLGKGAVLVAADGSLALFPFAALPGSKPDSYLVEERAIAHVSSGRHLLELAAPAKPTSNSLLVLGGLDFGKGDKWPELPGSRAEAKEVQAAFENAHPSDKVRARLLEGRKGTRAGLLGLLGASKEMPRWRYVHLATHALYDAPRQDKPVVVRGGVPSEEEGTPQHNPLLLARVVLAGANADPAEGTLTAEEVAGLDLRGCKLAVLSACETALGKRTSGEGVLGLQRAFHLAGARTVISSLWSVHDEATQALMRRFYAHLWSSKDVGALSALQQAQVEMLRQGLRDPVLVRGVYNPKTGVGKRKPLPIKDSSGRLAPAYWAAFVLSGDWR
jgi:CHAT domain-containing protein/Tfp pilus assembly protein PilF